MFMAHLKHSVVLYDWLNNLVLLYEKVSLYVNNIAQYVKYVIWTGLTPKKWIFWCLNIKGIEFLGIVLNQILTMKIIFLIG